MFVQMEYIRLKSELGINLLPFLIASFNFKFLQYISSIIWDLMWNM